MSGRVEVFHGTDVLEQFVEYIIDSGLYTKFTKNKPILLKVNMLMNAPADSGITTDVRIPEILAKYFLELDYDVIVGDGGDATCNTMISFENNGYVEMCENLGIKLINLNDGPMIPKVIGGVNMFINKYALESQVISIAKLKPHGMMGVTATLKNLMGTVLPKGHMHNNFTRKIEDVYNYIKPVYGVVDGLIANGRCENIACPVKMDTIICGDSLPLIDIVCSEIIGRSAEHIETVFKSEVKNKKLSGSILTEYDVPKLSELYSKGGIK